jgi:hypothetical protein
MRRMMHSLPSADTKTQPANGWASRSASQRHWVLPVLVWRALLLDRRVRLAGLGFRYWLRRDRPVRRGPSETTRDASLKAKPWQCASGQEASRMQPNVRAKLAPTAGRQARTGENVPRTARPGLAARRWGSA